MRCLALFTGGLDSLLAVRLLQQQGIEVLGLYISTPLCATGVNDTATAAERLAISLTTVPLEEAYCQLLRHPRFGWLEGSAPCLDCRIAMFALARRWLDEGKADFVLSGEVVGQRPRAAIRDLEVVAHHSGLEGLLLRPLSANLLPATSVEERGWIDRTRLLGMHGKGRKSQETLARSLGLASIPAPRPDCPLLAKTLGSRLQDLLDSTNAIQCSDLELLKIGRHIRLDRRTRVVLGRNRAENEVLMAFAESANRPDWEIVEPTGRGPTALVLGTLTQEIRDRVADLIVQYSPAAQATGMHATRNR